MGKWYYVHYVTYFAKAHESQSNLLYTLSESSLSDSERELFLAAAFSKEGQIRALLCQKNMLALNSEG